MLCRADSRNGRPGSPCASVVHECTGQDFRGKRASAKNGTGAVCARQSRNGAARWPTECRWYTYCLIVNPTDPEKTEKYGNAVGYGYYILTPEMFWKLLEQPQKSIEHPTENDVQITLCTHYAEPQRILMDVPADTVSFDLSKFPIDSVNDHAFSSCTKLEEITLRRLPD